MLFWLVAAAALTTADRHIKQALEGTAGKTAASKAMAIQQAVTECWREPLEDDGTIIVMCVEH